MTVDSNLVRSFRTAISGPPHEVDLLGSALVVAALSGTPPDGGRVRAQLDEIAQGARNYAGPDADSGALAGAIDYQLFTVMGFHGNSESYADPSNSYIDQVLDRRKGIPISLSLVYMEVAGRVGLACAGIGYPGHFIVRAGQQPDAFYIDPFHQGQRLDAAELRASLASADLRGARPETFLAAVTPRQMLQRMLNNLRMQFREQRDLERWRNTLDLALCIEPWNAPLVGERGMLNYRLGLYAEALEDLERYVATSGRATVAAGAIRLLGELRSRLKGEDANGSL